MDARLLFPKEFLCAADLQGKDVVLTISKLVSESLRTEKGEEDKWTLSFVEMEERNRRDRKKLNKRLVLNKTNAKTIAKLLGNETNDWQGKRIALYATTCLAFGKEADCIRIRDRAPAAKAKSNADVVPADEQDHLPEPPADMDLPNGPEEGE